MPFPLAAIKIGVSLFGMFSSNKRAKKAARLAGQQQKEMKKLKDQYAEIDTSNPYMNLENMYEDLTINQKEAQFARQGNQQNQANIMASLRQSAGASGIAALAQSLANQGGLDAQKASALIGRQEAANQKLERGEALRIQSAERGGDVLSRQLEFDVLQGQMGLTGDAMANARSSQRVNEQQRNAGIEGVLGGVGSMYDGGELDGTKLGNLLDR